MFQPYKSRRAFEDISEQIRQAILTKELCLGDRLPPERVLAEKFQVGRVSIREALRKLEAIGLIEIRKGATGGAFVKVADPNDTASIIMDRLQLEGTTHEQMVDARKGIECAVAEMAVRKATERDLQMLREDVERSATIIMPPFGREAFVRMTNFHVLLAEASHNLPYVMFVRSIMEWAIRRMEGWHPSEDDQRYSYEEHKGIFQAVAARDPDLAVRRMREHVEGMGRVVSRQFERS